MLIFTIYSAVNHLGLTISPPYKSDKQTTYLTPSHVGKAKSAVLQWKVLPIYIIYISPFTTSHTCPFGYARQTLNSHYRKTPIAAGQNETSPSAKKGTQINLLFDGSIQRNHPIVRTKSSIMTQETQQIGKTRPYLPVSRVWNCIFVPSLKQSVLENYGQAAAFPPNNPNASSHYKPHSDNISLRPASTIWGTASM